jgi:hypothetical protein
MTRESDSNVPLKVEKYLQDTFFNFEKRKRSSFGIMSLSNFYMSSLPFSEATSEAVSMQPFVVGGASAMLALCCIHPIYFA